MHKNDVLNAVPNPWRFMEEMPQRGRDTVARPATALMSGKCLTTANCVFSTGLDYGSGKVALSGYFASYPAIVNSSLTASRIIGSAIFLKSRRIILKLSTWSTMLPTFIKRDV